MRIHRSVVGPIAMLALSAAPVAAQGYGYGYGAYEEEGFFVFVEASIIQPGDTDQVVGQTLDFAGTVERSGTIAPDWSAGPAARIGFGYRWANGGELTASVWRFDDDTSIDADGPAGGFLDFAIGPSVFVGGSLVSFGDPGRARFDASLEATTLDLAFAHRHELAEVFDLEWSAGLRFASFDETLTGSYDLCASDGCTGGTFLPGEVTYAADRSTESTMFGLRTGLSARYRISDLVALRSGIALSTLIGDVESTSGLTPTGSVNAATEPTTRFSADESDRSGRIVDGEFGVEFDVMPDRLRLSVTYEHSVWDDVARDLARNPPGQFAINAPRDSVSFTGIRLGFWFRF